MATSPPSRKGDPPNRDKEIRASVRVRAEGDTAVFAVGGRWRLREARPDPVAFAEQADLTGVKRVIFKPEDLGYWDSSLALFVKRIREIAREAKVETDISAMPDVLEDWLLKLEPVPEPDPVPYKWNWPVLTWIGVHSTAMARAVRGMLDFLGRCLIAFWQVLANPGSLRWDEVIVQMRRAGAEALGIVGLITFLVGVILAFVAAMQLQQFGADIFVANLIGLAMFREMGAMMAAIVIAGRTGAAYAAELGNMRLNEEIDALETFGVSSMQFLVMPRMIALIVMMPMLTLYADFLGSLGGLLVSKAVLSVPAMAFVRQLEGAVQLNDVLSGLIKSCFFGMIVAYAGCMKGIRAERSAVGVGEATTAAVVLGILLIIVADAIFTVIFNVLKF